MSRTTLTQHFSISIHHPSLEIAQNNNHTLKIVEVEVMDYSSVDVDENIQQANKSQVHLRLFP
jgi:hypothetical protein